MEALLLYTSNVETSKIIKDINEVDSLVFMWFEEESEVYVGRSVDEVMGFFAYQVGEDRLQEVAKGHINPQRKVKHIDESGKIILTTLADLLKDEISKEGRSLLVPNQIWSAYT